MTPDDKRLVAALTILRNQLDPLIEELLAGQLDTDERRALAVVLATIAADLDPEIRAEEGTHPMRTPVVWPVQPHGGALPLPFSTSGP